MPEIRSSMPCCVSGCEVNATAYYTERLYHTKVGLCPEHEDEYQEASDLYRAETYHYLDVGMWLRHDHQPQPTSNDAMRDAVAQGQTAWLL